MLEPRLWEDFLPTAPNGLFVGGFGEVSDCGEMELEILSRFELLHVYLYFAFEFESGLGLLEKEYCLFQELILALQRFARIPLGYNLLNNLFNVLGDVDVGLD